MNNFGLKDLIIVNPREEWFNKKSINAAKKANNIINKAKIYDNINQALKNFTFVIGTTNRTRYLNKTRTNNFSKINQIMQSTQKVAILFGPENSGLSNQDLQLSDILFSINTNNNSNSLNLSHAVAITCFKIFELNKVKKINKQLIDKNNIVTKGQLSRYFDYLFENLSNKNFFVPKEKTNSMKNNIYNIYSKSPLTKKELQTLWGITKKLMK